VLTYASTFSLPPSSQPGTYYVVAELTSSTQDLTPSDNATSSILHVVAPVSPQDEEFASAASAIAGAPCTHYASPSGSGNGLSATSPFTVSKFWAAAAAGKTLCLLDGTYRGSSSMITPPSGRNGAAGKPITVRALNDGKVLIDGEGVRGPVVLNDNDYWVLEGFNAARSIGTVILVKNGSANNILRRLAAWDAHEGNYPVIGVNGSGTTKNLLEDVAAWGVGRNTITFAQRATDTTCRRCWARWDGSHALGGKVTYQLAYDSPGSTAENSIGAWSGELMTGPSYYLLNQTGTAPCTGSANCGKLLPGTFIDQPIGIFRAAINNSGIDTNTAILGSIAYLRASDPSKPPTGFSLGAQVTNLLLDNSIFYADSGITKRPLTLMNPVYSGSTLTARNATTIGGGTSSIGSQWLVTNLRKGSSLTAVPNVYDANQICTRYVNRTLTTTPLWPWPMNDRIKTGLLQSGRAPVDVTATVEAIFGAVPARCRQ
jgi:hypothetical protein